MKRHFSFLNLFFGVMILSTVGNVCAEFALFYYAFTKFGVSKVVESDLSSVGLFFIGSAVGRSIIAPILAVFFDKFSSRVSSFAIDISYIFVLIGILSFYSYSELTLLGIFIATTLTASLSQLHHSSVGFSAIKQNVQKGKGEVILATVFAIQNSAGLLVAGVISEYFGLKGCIYFALVTFIPILFLYPRIFPTIKDKIKPKEDFALSFKKGFHFLIKDKLLLFFGLSVLIFNFVGALIPAFVKYASIETFGTNNTVVGFILAGGLLLGTLFYRFFKKFAQKQSANHILPISFSLNIIALVIAYFFPNIYAIGFLYLTACFGSGLRNVVIMGLRKERIPKELTARVNTLYSALINVGQIMGGLFIIPVSQSNLRLGIQYAFVVVCFSGIFAFFFIPKVKVSEAIK